MLKEQIKQKRIGLKVTQEQMAKHLGISRNGYIRLENAAKTISFDQIDTICHVLGLRVILISEAEFKAKNALKINPEYWEGILQLIHGAQGTLESTKTPK